MQKSVQAIEQLLKECKERLFTNPPLAEEKAREALELSTRCGYDEGCFESLFALSRISNVYNQNTHALKYYEECLQIAERLKEPKKIALAKNALGITYNDMGVHSKALEYFLEVLELVKKHGLTEIECRVNNNIASIFSDIKDHKNGLKYLLLAYEKAITIREPLALYLRNIANCYMDLEDYERAYQYCILARNANWQERDEDVWADIYFILAVVLVRKGRPLRSSKAFELGFTLSRKYHSFYSCAEGYIDRASIYKEDHRYLEAMSCLDEAYNISAQYHYLGLLQKIHKLDAEICRCTGDTARENQTLREYLAITEKLEEGEYDKKRIYAAMQVALFSIRKEHQYLKENVDKDPLTGCLCSRDFESKITHALEDSDKHGAMLFLDVDNLKLVNDRYGHPAGDKLIVEFANTLNKVFGDKALQVRKGGDEFIVFLPRASRNYVIQLLEEMYAALSRPRVIGKSLMPLSCSIGVALAPCDSTSVKELEAMADKAMYRAKNSGKRCYCFYDSLSIG